MNAKHILTGILCLCLAATSVAMPLGTAFAAGESDSGAAGEILGSKVFGDYLYKEVEGGVEITAYSTMAKDTEITVPSEIDGKPVVSIGEHGMYGTPAETITLPETVTNIGDQAFGNSRQLRTINIPDGVTNIGQEAFLGCSRLRQISLPEGLKSIGTRAFCNSGLTSVILPESLESLGESVFDSCYDLSYVQFKPSKIDTLPAGTFFCCDSLLRLDLPETIRSIGKRSLPDMLRTLVLRASDCTLDEEYEMMFPHNCELYLDADSELWYQIGYELRERLHSLANYALESYFFDVNADSSFDILDIITFAKFLHTGGELAAPAAADVNADGDADIFDLAFMMRALVGQEINMDVPVNTTAKNLAAQVKPGSVKTVKLSDELVIRQTQFALDLLRDTIKEDDAAGNNVLISPYSVSQALGMTANGAAGDTRTEMENVLGGSMDTLNPAFYTIRQNTDTDTDSLKIHTANSIWFKDGYAIRDDFLQTDMDYYSAEVYEAPFDDSTVKDINNWVNKKTDRMIPSILDEIGKEDRVILVNAVAFDALWEEPYLDAQVEEETFTAADGTKQTVQMMHDELHTYIEDEHAAGFLRFYQGHYAFAALLPEEGMTPEAYLDTLDAEGLHDMLSSYSATYTKVETGLPQFTYDFGTNLDEPLKTMGMPGAFQPGADFSAMTDDPDGLYIGDVIHKTHIEMTQVGTRAAAATLVDMKCGAALDPEKPKEVILDRPFVYMIVDTDNWMPLFIGTVNSIE